MARGPLSSGKKEVRSEPLSHSLIRWTQSCPRTGGGLNAVREHSLVQLMNQASWAFI